MDENYTTQKLLSLRKLTRSIGELVREQMKENVATLTPLFRQKAVFGDNIQGGGKEHGKGADQAFKELQNLYEAVAPAKPFFLPKELKSPIIQMTGSLELAPVEYPHAITTDRGNRTITITRPFTFVLAYSGYAPGRLKEVLNDLSRSNGELQQFVLHYLVMRVVISKQPGLTRIMDALHFPIESGPLPGFGELPITFVRSAVSTNLPPDELIVESTELSGKDAFEEIVDVSGIEKLGDSFKERLLKLANG